MKNKYKLPFSFLFLFTVLFVQAQTAEEIIDKHIEVLGGKKKLTSLKSVKRVFKTDNELAGSGSVIMVVDQGARVESEMLFGTTLMIANKKKGWTIINTPLSEKPEIKEMSETDRSLSFPSIDLDIDKILPWNIITSYIRYGPSKHITLTLLGKETIDGKDCFKVKIKYVGTETWYIDSNTWNLVQVQKGAGDEATTIRYSDFKKDANEVLLPYKEQIIGKDGKVLITSTNTEFETNIKVDKSTFTYKP
jgi:hypothetical protein